MNLGQDNQERLKRDNSLIEQLDCDLFSFVGTHEKLEAVSNYSMELLRNLKEARQENKKLST